MTSTSLADGRAPSPVPSRCERPWGWFETLASGPGYLVKRLRVRAGARLSLQRHRHRSEHWVVVGGDGLLECDGTILTASGGTSLFIPAGAVHRASGGRHDLEIIEVQRGDLLSEDDIERFADDYGRLPVSGFAPDSSAPPAGQGEEPPRW